MDLTLDLHHYLTKENKKLYQSQEGKQKIILKSVKKTKNYIKVSKETNNI